MLWPTSIVEQQFALLSEGVPTAGRPSTISGSTNEGQETHRERWRN